MNRVLNKNTLIMGGTSGIGRAIVDKFSQEGANIVFCGRNETKGKAIQRECKNAKFIVCDVLDKTSIQSFFNAAHDIFDKLDIAINNSGISGMICNFHETDDSSLENVMRTNFYGTWYCMQQEISWLIENHSYGSILNIASTSGLIGNGLGLTPYSASKHAIIGLTKSTALEYAKNNIRINALCPGFVDTPMTQNAAQKSRMLKRKIPLMHPMGRVGTTDEIANAALYLCSDEATFTTGSCMIIDGGLTT